MLGVLGSMVSRSIRVIRVSARPTGEEFNMTAKITGLGMVLIGAIGYIITIIFNFIG